MNAIPVPCDLRSERLYFRRWQKADAVLLLPVLEANVDHLGDWIPAHVSAPAPLNELELRLAGFAEDFQSGRNWRFAIFSADQSDVFGEVSLFPRSAEGRVDFASADRLEIGYWLRYDATGRGYATEAARAMLGLAIAMPEINTIEVHCDPRNTASAAVPQRLGFRLMRPGSEPDRTLPDNEAGMLWAYDLRNGDQPAPDTTDEQ
jgi:RimJ/RimL family protein N-acetyltransferase